MEKTKSWYMRLRMSDRFANEMNCFTLGGSLIPPQIKIWGYCHPGEGGLRAASRVNIRLSEGVKRKWHFEYRDEAFSLILWRG